MPLQLVPHEFTYPELDYDSKANFEPCIKVSIFFKKLDSITFDTFFEHWRTAHADLTVTTQAFRDNIVRYTQVCSIITVDASIAPSLSAAGSETSTDRWPPTSTIRLLK